MIPDTTNKLKLAVVLEVNSYVFLILYIPLHSYKMGTSIVCMWIIFFKGILFLLENVHVRVLDNCFIS